MEYEHLCQHFLTKRNYFSKIELKGIQKRYPLHPFSPLISLEQSLQHDHQSILTKEREFWSKKSRIN